MIRVRHLIKGLGRGGAEMLLAEGYPFRDAERFDYGYAYFLPWKDAMVPMLREQGADVRCIEARSSAACVAAAHRVAWWLRKEKADIVHCHLPVASIVGRLAGKLAGARVVSTEHNLIEGYHPMTQTATRATWSLQDHVVSVSAEVEASIGRTVGDRVPVQTVLNGVSTQRFRRVDGAMADLRERLGLAPDAHVVGTVAVFRKHKRLDLWLRAAEAIAERDPKAHFVLVGDGPLKPDVEGWIAERGLQEKVTLPGLIEDVRPWVSGFDIYLMSSDVEGLPVALLEAMSMETACVVTDVGGIAEALRHEQDGLLAERRDWRTLADRTLELLGSPERRRAMGASARAEVERRFGMGRMVSELEGIYDAVLAS